MLNTKWSRDRAPGGAGNWVSCALQSWVSWSPHAAGHPEDAGKDWHVHTGLSEGLTWGQWINRETYFHWRCGSRWVSLPPSPSRYFYWSAPGLPQRYGCQLLGTPWTCRYTCQGPGPRCSQSCKAKCGDRRGTLLAISHRTSSLSPWKYDQLIYFMSQLNIIENSICCIVRYPWIMKYPRNSELYLPNHETILIVEDDWLKHNTQDS